MASPCYNDSMLIKEVRQRQILYSNKKQNAHIKKKAWESVANTLGLDVEAAINRWKYLRDSFVREKKRLLVHGKEAYCKNEPWPLLEEMAFLWDFVKHKRLAEAKEAAKSGGADKTVTGNYKVLKEARSPNAKHLPSSWISLELENSSDTLESCIIIDGDPDDNWAQERSGDEADDASVTADEEIQVNELSDSAMKIGSFQCKPELKTETAHSSQDVEMLHLPHLTMGTETELQDSVGAEHMHFFVEKSRTDYDEDELFCLSVRATMKRFSPEQRAFAKMEIQKILYQVECQEASDYKHGTIKLSYA